MAEYNQQYNQVVQQTATVTVGQQMTMQAGDMLKLQGGGFTLSAGDEKAGNISGKSLSLVGTDSASLQSNTKATISVGATSGVEVTASGVKLNGEVDAGLPGSFSTQFETAITTVKALLMQAREEATKAETGAMQAEIKAKVAENFANKAGGLVK